MAVGRIHRARRWSAAALAREWRNWQTRRIQVPVPARAWGFKSPLAHLLSALGNTPRSARDTSPGANSGCRQDLSTGQANHRLLSDDFRPRRTQRATWRERGARKRIENRAALRR